MKHLRHVPAQVGGELQTMAKLQLPIQSGANIILESPSVAMEDPIHSRRGGGLISMYTELSQNYQPEKLQSPA